MAIVHYLAMTAAEMAAVSPIPPKTAWMACHFSPYSTGLVNLPDRLPAGSLLILNDRTPIHGHDPVRIADALSSVLHRFSCCGLVMDFQNPGSPETAALAAALVKALPCPVAVTPHYPTPGAAVLLPPIPTDMTTKDYLTPWVGKQIWLETALAGQTITLTEQGASLSENRSTQFVCIHADPQLHCHYNIQAEQGRVIFHTWRTEADFSALLSEAEAMGVETAVGLYQEFPSGAQNASGV